MNGELSDRVIAVSGALGGIGKSIVSALCDEGALVVGVDMGSPTSEAPGNIAKVDVTDIAAVSRWLSRVQTDYGLLDGLVIAHGTTHRSSISEMPYDAWRRVMSVNLDAAFNLLHSASGVMRQGRGSVVAISSIASSRGVPERAGYAASKAGLEALCKTAALEWAAKMVRVNVVAPGYTRTAMVASGIEQGLLSEQSIHDAIPMRRMATPDEIAAAVLFLLGDRASYITGTKITVDGGFLADYAVKLASQNGQGSQ